MLKYLGMTTHSIEEELSEQKFLYLKKKRERTVALRILLLKVLEKPTKKKKKLKCLMISHIARVCQSKLRCIYSSVPCLTQDLHIFLFYLPQHIDFPCTFCCLPHKDEMVVAAPCTIQIKAGKKSMKQQDLSLLLGNFKKYLGICLIV